MNHEPETGSDWPSAERTLRALHDIVLESSEDEIDRMIVAQGGQPDLYAANGQRAVRNALMPSESETRANAGLGLLRKALAKKGSERNSAELPSDSVLSRLMGAFAAERPELGNALVQYAAGRRSHESEIPEDGKALHEFADYVQAHADSE